MSGDQPGKRLESLAIELWAADTFEALRHWFVKFFTREGAAMMSYHHLPPPGAKDHVSTISVASHGFPGAWVQKYLEKGFFRVDPIPRRALDATRPFWCSDVARTKGPTGEERAFMEDLTDANFGDGVAVAVFGPHGRNGYVGIGFGVSDRRRWSDETIARFQIAAQLGHNQYCYLLKEKAPAGVSLSSREREILSWMARGKSNSAIGEILGISPNTVDTYARRIYDKLDVAGRVTAALRGLALGEIE